VLLTHDGSEMPDILRVEFHEWRRHTHDQNESIGDAQVHDEAVGRTAHVRMSPHDHDDEEVSCDAKDEEERVDEGDWDEDVDGRIGDCRRRREYVRLSHGRICGVG